VNAQPKPAPARAMTVRAQIVEELRHGMLGAHELSQRVRVRERDIALHLEHIQRSLRHGAEELSIQPARCMGCDYVFRDRRRLSSPSRCPRCQNEHVEAPRFSIVAR